MAHSKGAMPEEDANLVAAYICLNSEDPYIRYSGYDVCFWSLESFVMATNNKQNVEEFYNSIDDNIYRNNNYEYDYWTNHATFEKSLTGSTIYILSSITMSELFLMTITSIPHKQKLNSLLILIRDIRLYLCGCISTKINEISMQ